MMMSTQFWLRCLLWLVFGLAMLSAIIIIIKERLREQLENGRLGTGWGRSLLVITGEKVNQRASLVAMFLLGALIGYGWRDHQFYSDRYFYVDVKVVARHDDRNFTLQPARMQPWEATVCEPQDWQPGQMMRFMQYQQRPGCKDVSARGAFEFYSDNGRRLEVLDAGN